MKRMWKMKYEDLTGFRRHRPELWGKANDFEKTGGTIFVFLTSSPSQGIVVHLQRSSGSNYSGIPDIYLLLSVQQTGLIHDDLARVEDGERINRSNRPTCVCTGYDHTRSGNARAKSYLAVARAEHGRVVQEELAVVRDLTT